MAIDEVRQETTTAPQGGSHSGAWIAVFVVLALLVVGEIYSLNRIGSVQSSVNDELATMRKDMDQQFTAKLATMSDSNAQQLDALRSELDSASKRMGSTTSRELTHARAMVAKLEQQQQQQADELKQEIAKKADDEKVGALSQDVNATKADLGSTKQTVDTLTKDLGMARSDMGTLIARNHDDIETLRKLGERNYYEFTLTKNQAQTVGGVRLMLRKTNVKHQRFNLNLLTNDLQIEKNNRTIDEPIFFSVNGAKAFSELVVNKVDQNTVAGYISTPKFERELAQTSSTSDAANK